MTGRSISSGSQAAAPGEGVRGHATPSERPSSGGARERERPAGAREARRTDTSDERESFVDVAAEELCEVATPGAAPATAPRPPEPEDWDDASYEADTVPDFRLVQEGTLDRRVSVEERYAGYDGQWDRMLRAVTIVVRRVFSSESPSS